MTGQLRPLSHPTSRHALCLAAALAAGLLSGFVPATAADQLDPQGAISNPPPPTSEVFRKQIELKYRTEALRNNQPDKSIKELIDQAIHFQVYQIGDPKQAHNRVENIRKLIDQLRANNTSPNARTFTTEQIILRCDQLLAEPSASVRIAACYLLNSLNTSWNPDIPYVPVADVLLKVLTFGDDQYIQVKIVAAEGLARILRDAPLTLLSSVKRAEIAEKIAAEVDRLHASRDQLSPKIKDGYEWTMWKLIQALGFSDRVTNQSRQPVVADALQRVMFDHKEDWLTRARAADALCRLPYEGNANLAVLNYECARLLHDGAQQFNSELAAGILRPMWRRFALHMYMAYESQNQASRNLNLGLMYQVNRPGLGNYKGPIQAVRGLMIPIVNAWVSHPPIPNEKGVIPLPPQIPAGDIENLATWLNANAPPPNTKLLDDSRVVPQGPAPQPKTAPAANVQ